MQIGAAGSGSAQAGHIACQFVKNHAGQASGIQAMPCMHASSKGVTVRSSALDM